MAQTDRNSPKPPEPVLIVHPILLALYPVLGLYANNVRVSPGVSIVRPAAVLCLGAIALWIVLAIMLRKIHKAGIVASLFLVACMSGWSLLEFCIRATMPYVGAAPTLSYYIGYVAVEAAGIGAIAFIWRKQPKKILWPAAAWTIGWMAVPLLAEFVFFGAFSRGAAWYVALYLVAVTALLTVTLRHQGDFRRLTRTGNWFGVTLVCLYLALIAYNRPKTDPPKPPPLENVAAAEKPASCPDIYLIALEGYPRSDELRRRFAYNNLPFESDLRDLGFTIASQSTANYTNPELAITACLNLDYVQDLVPLAGDGVTTVTALYHDNRAVDFLRQNGYRVIGLSPGLDSLELQDDASTCLKPPRSLTEFEMVLLSGAIASRVMQVIYSFQYDNPAYWRYAPRRQRALFAFDELPRLAAQKSGAPRFIFARFLIPAPPFLFTRSGDRARPFGITAVGDDTTFRGSGREFAQSYIEQLHYTNRRVLDAAQGIIKESSRPPVILVVSTQGSSPIESREEPGQTSDAARFANLIMAYYPQSADAPDTSLYGSISLVNVLRVTFNRVLGTRLAMLPDKAFVSPDDKPFEIQPASLSR